MGDNWKQAIFTPAHFHADYPESCCCLSWHGVPAELDTRAWTNKKWNGWHCPQAVRREIYPHMAQIQGKLQPLEKCSQFLHRKGVFYESMINATRVPFPFSATSPLWFCLATVLKYYQNSLQCLVEFISHEWKYVMENPPKKQAHICLCGGLNQVHLHGSLDVHLKIFSFQVFSKKQGYITSTASAHQRPAVEGM